MNALIEEVEIYRNAGVGLTIAESTNVINDGGIFSDNRGSNVDVHRSENILINNTSIVGKSDTYDRLETTHSGLANFLCPDRRVEISAVEIHSFTRNRGGHGITLENVAISGIDDIKNCKEYAILIDPEVSRRKTPQDMNNSTQATNTLDPGHFSRVDGALLIIFPRC